MTQPFSRPRTRLQVSLDDLSEATRLTRAGRLREATALLQGRPGADPSDPAAAGRHASILPERVREAVGQVVRSLGRGIAPALKDPSRTRPGADPARGPDTGGTASTPGTGTFHDRTFADAGGSRGYKLYVPGRGEGLRPLVVMLHGCTQSPEDFAAGTGMNALAEAEGVFVAYPRQTRRANAQKCWNWFQPGDQVRGAGEAAIIAGITRAVVAEHPIDPARIFIAGFSAGGAAAANVARAYPDLYAAAGIHSGLAAGCAQDLPAALAAMRVGAPGMSVPGGPGRGFGSGPAADGIRVPVIVFHGDGDQTVHPRNGEAVLAQAGAENLIPARSEMRAEDGRAYTRTRYDDEAGRTVLESWVVQGSGHAWSGGSPAGSYTDPGGPDASRAMLDFFLAQRPAGGRT